MKSRLAVGLCALLFGAVFVAVEVPVASAHVGGATISCTNVTFTYFANSGFNSPASTVYETVSVDGTQVASGSVTIYNDGGGTDTLAITVPAGTHTVTADAYTTAQGEVWQTYDGALFPVSATLTCQSTSPGCTLTIGYWKTHAGFGPQADAVSPLLPISLGSGGGKTQTVSTAALAVQFLGLKGSNGVFDASNGINKLYAQLLGAKLSIASGASPSAVASVVSAADSFLAGHDSSDWAGLSGSSKSQVLAWMDALNSYNNGQAGPPAC